MKSKKGMSIISFGIMVILIVSLAVSIIMLLMTALNDSIDKAPTYIDEILGD